MIISRFLFLCAFFVRPAIVAVALFFSILVNPSAASDSIQIWTDSTNNKGSAIAKRSSQIDLSLLPDEYRLLQLDETQMRSTLLRQQNRKAPLRKTQGSAPVTDSQRVELPLPDGRMLPVSIRQNSVMAPALAAQFPQIRTWRIESESNNGVYGVVDMTEHGFHAMLFMPDGTRVFVDPRQSGNKTYYISYLDKHYHPADKEPHQCALTSQTLSSYPAASRASQTSAVRSGENLRTYRLAMAATGEYTAYHGGTVAGAMSAIVTTISRVNMIYERDLAIKLELVANNQVLIRTDKTTYSNSDPIAMLTENQTQLDSLIGSSNYDIGHVVSTGYGGIAYLGSACSNSKAGGVTGSPTPETDAFDIDFVAHEIAHQLGGSHTFNSETGNCGAGNRYSPMAFEPGSGTTILAYAGICGVNNTQNNSDAMFHIKSIEQITQFVEDPTQGGACGIQTSLNNAQPLVNAGSNYTIPANTPFELRGSGSDPDGDVLTYSWEQVDAGGVSDIDVVLSDNAIFRTFLPQPEPVRIFPTLENILNNTASKGETLPDISRVMNFSLAVRDQKGGVNSDQMVINVVNSDAFKITSHNTPATLKADSSTTITWDVAGTDATPVSCPAVNILLSTDEGQCFSDLLGYSTNNDGSERITIPADVPASSYARFKVKCANSIFFDISDANLTITSDALATNTGSATVAPGLTIPDRDPAGILSEITLAGVGVKSQPSINIEVDITHRYRDELSLELISPQGTTVLLKQRDNSNGADIKGNYPFSLVPVESLAAFNGENLDGVWKLKVVDNVPGDTGRLNSWSLRYARSACEASAATNTTPVASNSDLVTQQEIPVSGQLVAIDNENNPLTYILLNSGTLGTATLTNAATGDFVYTPLPGKFGQDRITFKVNDGTLDSNIATVTITVNKATSSNPSTGDLSNDTSAGGGGAFSGLLLFFILYVRYLRGRS